MLPNERAGELILETRLLPYFEREALSKIWHRLPDARPAGRTQTDQRTAGLRICRALSFADADGDVVLWQAAQVLLLAEQLREALAARPAAPHRVGALAIAMACEAMVGGFDLEHLAVREQRDDVTAKHEPFSNNKGKRTAGQLKRHVIKIIPGLERRLGRKSSALEVWEACKAKAPRSLEFINKPNGKPDHVWSDAGQTQWPRFMSLVSEARRGLRDAAKPGPR